MFFNHSSGNVVQKSQVSTEISKIKREMHKRKIARLCNRGRILNQSIMLPEFQVFSLGRSMNLEEYGFSQTTILVFSIKQTK